MPPGPRTRPAKTALSREAVVAAALRVVDEVGYDAASMRRVAGALETGPASLYVYVADRRELMEAVHDLALADVAVPGDADGDWRARLELLIDRIVEALSAHADVAMAAIAEVPLGPHSLRLNEEMLRLLRVGGIDDAACAWAADLIGQYVASSALEQAAWDRVQREIADPDRATIEAMGAAFAGRIDAVYAALDPAAFPTLVALRPLLTGGGGDARASWKLRVIVDGLLAQGVAARLGARVPIMGAMTLLAALLAGGLDDPEAIRIGDTTMSGPELLGAAAVVADQIADRPAEGPVAVLAEPTAHAVVAMVGGLVAGAPVVPVPPDVGSGERAHLLADSGASLWIGERPTDVSLPVRKVDLSRRSGDVAREAPHDGPALVLYTSGTTGAPKGVLLSRAAMASGLDGLADAWEWTADDTLAHGLPLFHVHGLVLGVFGALRLGSRLVHVGRPRPDLYAAAVRDHGASLLFGVPTVWSRIAADPAAAEALRSARLLVSGSAPLPVPVFEKLRELTGQAPVERYGMSETMITLSVRADGERRAGWVGVPVAGVETRLVSTDEETDGELLPHDGESIGELQVRGPGLFTGYLGRPEATADTWTKDRWFRTGDAAVIDADGYHRIVGRRSVDLIKTGGYRVGAGEIETALLEHDGISEAAVIGEPDDDLGQRIVAHVVLAGGPVDPEEVIAFVAERLSIHKRPREVRVVDALPRNAMGKVQKARLASG